MVKVRTKFGGVRVFLHRKNQILSTAKLLNVKNNFYIT